jgi:hypothetical protein
LTTFVTSLAAPDALRVRSRAQAGRLRLSWVLVWALLLTTVVTLTTDGAPPALLSLPRSMTWTQRGADFLRGSLQGLIVTVAGDGALRLAPDAPHHRGVYISAPTAFGLPLTALAVRLDADIPPDTDLSIEVRTAPDGAHWSPWAPIYTLEPDADGRLSAENLVMAAPGDRWAQARVTFSGQAEASPVVRELSLVAIDASRGPGLAQLMPSAHTRQAAPPPAGVPQPRIISRAEWGANEAWMTWPPAYGAIQKIIIHHTVTGNAYTDPAAVVRSIYYYHTVVRGWGDIGYNYLVDRFGNIYEGRYGGPGVVGSHTLSYNIGSVGIGALGTFGNAAGSVDPSSNLIRGLVDLSAWIAAQNGLDPLGQSYFVDGVRPNIAGHRDYDITSCPGDYLYDDLASIRQATWQRLQEAALPKRRAEFGAHTTPATLTARQTVQVNVTVRNSGSMTWPAGGDHPVRLGYHWVDANGQVVVQPPEDDHRTPLPRDVAPGEEITLAGAELTAPIAPGNYTLKWDMVHEGVTWFETKGSATLNVAVAVTVPAAHQVYLPIGVQNSGSQPGPPLPPPPGPAPTPPPAPTSGCQNLLVNGNFEGQEGWVINVTDRVAVYSNLRRHGGRWSMRAGVPPGGWNFDSYSSFEQAVTIPAEARSARLRFWRLALTDDPSNDFQYVFLRVAGGAWQELLMEHSNAGVWQETEFDLTAYAGQTIRIRFGAYNNGRGGVTSLWIDDASLIVCR